MEHLADPVFLSRLQFAWTTMFHILWPLLTIGLSVYIFACEGLWLATRDAGWRRQYRFWTPFFLLAFEHDPDPELRSPIITPENRDMLLTAMMLAVERIYDYFAPHRGRPATAAAIRRDRMPAKPGRNAPCPCGSGLKYKRCCGK